MPIEDELMFIMNVKRKDGTADRVVVRPSDDPYKLASDYVQKYKLSSAVIEKLAKKIDKQRQSFFLGFVEKNAAHPSNDTVSTSSFSSTVAHVKNPNNNDDALSSDDTGRAHSVVGLTNQQETSNESNFPPAHTGASSNSNSNRDNDDNDNNFAKNFLNQFISQEDDGFFFNPPIGRSDISGQKTQGNSSLEDVLTRAEHDGKRSEQESPEEVYNRAKEHWMSSPNSMEPRSVSYSITSPNLYVRSPQPLSSSKASSMQHDGESPSIFHRLFSSATLYQERQQIRKRQSDEREAEEIERSKFRLPENSPYSIKNLKATNVRSGSNFGEQLYNTGQRWQKKIDDNIDRERRQKEDKLRAEEDAARSNTPKLFKPPKKVAAKLEQQEHSPVYKHLYDHQYVQQKELKTIRNSYEKELEKSLPFKPSIYTKSVALSAHARDRKLNIESMIREETLYGKVSPTHEKITRRASVMKALEADFPAYMENKQNCRDNSSTTLEGASFFNIDDTYSAAPGKQLKVDDSSWICKSEKIVSSSSSMKRESITNFPFAMQAQNDSNENPTSSGGTSVVSSLFPEVDSTEEGTGAFVEEIETKSSSYNLTDMLQEDRIRITELIEDKHGKTAEQQQKSKQEETNRKAQAEEDEVERQLALDRQACEKEDTNHTAAPAFYIPSPAGFVVRSPLFKDVKSGKVKIVDNKKVIDPSKKKIGELDPKTVVKFNTASKSLNDQILHNTPTVHHMKGYKDTVFEHLYQDHFYKAVHLSKRELNEKKTYPHKPDIGVNKYMTVEKNRSEFFQRLYRHENPDIGLSRSTGNNNNNNHNNNNNNNNGKKKRSSSADSSWLSRGSCISRDNTRSRSGSNVNMNATNRSRSVSRDFTTQRRAEFQKAQDYVKNKCVIKKSSSSMDDSSRNSISNREPWGHFGGHRKSKDHLINEWEECATDGPTTPGWKRRKQAEPRFYKFVYDNNYSNDCNDETRYSKDNTPMKNFDEVGATKLSRDRQLKLLGDKQFNKVCPRRIMEKKITEAQEQLLVNKMDRDVMRRKVQSDERKKKVEADTKSDNEKKYVNNKSKIMTENSKQSALSEIFNVLLISVEYSKSHNTKSLSEQGVVDEEEDENDIGSRGLLDTSLAVPAMLKPPELAKAVANVIHKYKPRAISRDVFIAAVSNFMTSGRGAPLNFLLSIPNTAVNRGRSNREAQGKSIDSEQRNLVMPAHKTTETYVQGRKEFMKQENIAHHDLIYAYDQIYRQKAIDNRQALLRKEKAACTFKPVLSTRPTSRSYWSNRADQRLSSKLKENHSKRSEGATYAYSKRSGRNFQSENSNLPRTDEEEDIYDDDFEDGNGSIKQSASSISGNISNNGDSISIESSEMKLGGDDCSYPCPMLDNSGTSSTLKVAEPYKPSTYSSLYDRTLNVGRDR